MPVRLTDLSLTVLETQYAVRGPIVARAAELEKAGLIVTDHNPEYVVAGKTRDFDFARLKAACEEAKIDLSRKELSGLSIPELCQDEKGATVDVVFERAVPIE